MNKSLLSGRHMNDVIVLMTLMLG